eukprot:5298555-Ditylum_brightwellii.AAC.1
MKQDQKLETVSYLLANSTADFLCLQETWLEGDPPPKEITTPKAASPKVLFFHHGQADQSNRGSGG